MASATCLTRLMELKEMAQDALGTPELVNFHALYKVLVGILGQIAALHNGMKKMEKRGDLSLTTSSALQGLGARKSLDDDDDGGVTAQSSTVARQKERESRHRDRIVITDLVPSGSEHFSASDSSQLRLLEDKAGDQEDDKQEERRKRRRRKEEEEQAEEEYSRRASKTSTHNKQRKTSITPPKTSKTATTPSAGNEYATLEDESGDDKINPGPHPPSSSHDHQPARKPSRKHSNASAKEGKTSGEVKDKSAAGARKAPSEQATAPVPALQGKVSEEKERAAETRRSLAEQAPVQDKTAGSKKAVAQQDARSSSSSSLSRGGGGVDSKSRDKDACKMEKTVLEKQGSEQHVPEKGVVEKPSHQAKALQGVSEKNASAAEKVAVEKQAKGAAQGSAGSKVSFPIGKEPTADDHAHAIKGKVMKRRTSTKNEEDGGLPGGSNKARRVSILEKRLSIRLQKSIDKDVKKEEEGGGGGRGRGKERKGWGKGGEEVRAELEPDHRDRTTTGSGGRSTPTSMAGDDGEEPSNAHEEQYQGSVGRRTRSTSGSTQSSVSPLPLILDHVSRKDLEDMVKRIFDLEKEVTRMQLKTSKKALSKDTGGSGTFVTSPGSSLSSVLGVGAVKDKDIELLERREKGLQRHLEKIEKDFYYSTDELWKEVNDMHTQLHYLPHPNTLFKSFFPSWKMIEDALCPYSSLTFNIAEVKDAVEMGKTGQGSAASKQLSKFLGASGPSERLLESFSILSGLIEQGRRGPDASSQFPREPSFLRTVTSSTPKDVSKFTVEGKSYQKIHSGQTVDETGGLAAGSNEMSASSRADYLAEDLRIPPIPKLECGVKPGDDAGYTNFKFGKLAEETVNLRKEVCDMLPWKDRLDTNEDDIKSIMNHILVLRRDMESAEDRNHELLGNLEMELNELSAEICGAMSKRTMLTNKEEMDSFRQRKRSGAPQDSRTVPVLGDIVIDREARIRTQQLQLQLNVMHHMLAEVEGRLPPHWIRFSSASGGMPDSVQHPWGTGRAGAGTSIRTGSGGVASPGAAISTTTTSSSPTRMILEARPTPLGGGGSETTEKLSQSGKESKARDKITPTAVMLASEQIISAQSQIISAQSQVTERESGGEREGGGKQDREEKFRTQFAITRLNQTQSNMETRLEACQNQQSAEMRRLQVLMTRMQREYMMRCSELEEQITEVAGIKSEAGSIDRTDQQGNQNIMMLRSDAGHVTAPKWGDRAEGKRKGVLTNRGGAQRPSGFTQDMLFGLRQELLGYIKAVSKKLRKLENTIPFLDIPEHDAALMKKPILHRFQCLSCDKKIDVSQNRADTAFPPSSVVPELPRLPLLPSPPPRLRNYAKAMGDYRQRNMPDIYGIPRQCGGRYTASSKRRRLQIMASLGDTIEVPAEPKNAEKIDVEGIDGHIYRGQVKKSDFNNSTLWCCLASRRDGRHACSESSHLSISPLQGDTQTGRDY